MALRDFFRSVREKKFTSKLSSTDNNGLSDEEIAANWVKCKACEATIHKSKYADNFNICPECNAHGRISLDERISLLLDEAQILELNADISAGDPLEFNDGKPYPETLRKAQQKTGQKEAIVTGTASINGIQIAIAIMNFDFLGGSMGSVVGEKFTRIVELAIEKRLPFIGIAASGGARMHEGILSLMQMAKTSIALDRLSKAKLPYFSIVTDPTYGGVSASYAMLGDLIIAEPGARIGFAGRRVIEETVREKLPADFQTAEYLLEHGQIDLIVDRREMKTTIAHLLQVHGFVSQSMEVPASIPNQELSTKSINQPTKEIPLDFEKPLLKIQEEIKHLEKKISNEEDKQALSKLKSQYMTVERSVYMGLTAIDITKIARHPNRPTSSDYLDMIAGTNKWIEIHGDRAGTDDAAICTALAEIDGINCIVVGTRKGRSIKENQKCNFGMPQPEGYRKARRAFEYAQKFNLPIITFVDTPGAYPGLNAEANGQSIAIAENLKVLGSLIVPVLAIITGEGGSGGALAIGVANKVLMLENAVYSVISPEGCAAILWRTREKAPEAAEALKITAKDLYKLKIIDEIIPEPFGGAHRDWAETANLVNEAITRNLRELMKLSPQALYEHRVEKFYSYGAAAQTASTKA